MNREREREAQRDAAEYLETLAEYHGIGNSDCAEEDCDHDWHCHSGKLCGHEICNENGCLLFRAHALRWALNSHPANSLRAAGYQSSAQQGASDSNVETGSGARSVSEYAGAAPDSQQGEKP